MSARDIIAVCQAQITRYPNDCAGFVRAVAQACGVPLTGSANLIVNSLGAGRRISDGLHAKQAAANGDLVIAGVSATGHGHVVIVVEGPLNRGKYPYCFWGQYHGLKYGKTEYNIGFTRGHGTLNYAFGESTRDSVMYAAFSPIKTLLPSASPGTGYLLHTFT